MRPLVIPTQQCPYGIHEQTTSHSLTTNLCHCFCHAQTTCDSDYLSYTVRCRGGVSADTPINDTPTALAVSSSSPLSPLHSPSLVVPFRNCDVRLDLILRCSDNLVILTTLAGDCEMPRGAFGRKTHQRHKPHSLGLLVIITTVIFASFILGDHLLVVHLQRL